MDPFNAVNTQGNECGGWQGIARASINLEAGGGPIGPEPHVFCESEQDNEEYEDYEDFSETGLSEQQSKQENSLIDNEVKHRIPLEAEADPSCKSQVEVHELNKIVPNDNMDTEYGGVNFSNLWREMTMNKMWHERTWSEILKHFFKTMMIGVLPTFFDIGTDVHAVYEYYVENHPVWSLTTLFLVFFPGFFFSFWIRQAFKINCCKATTNCWCFLFHPLSPIGALLFPFILIGVKIVGLFNPGPEWKRLTVKVTAFEGDFEASLQLLLSLYIIFTQAEDRRPEWWQVAQLVASMVMITKTAIADFLLSRQPMNFKAELKATIYLVPLFLTNCAFKVLSLALTAAEMGWYSFFVFPLVIALLHLPDLCRCCCSRSCSCCPREQLKYLTMGTPKHMVKLLVIKQGRRTNKDSMINFFYNNIFWLIIHSSLLLLTSLTMTLHIEMCAVIFVALILNIVLIYFQLWRPYKAEKGENIEAGVNGTEEDQVKGQDGGKMDKGIEEEGSKGVCICCAFFFLFCIIVLFLFFLPFYLQSV